MKYKVGDKVRLKDDLRHGDCNGYYVCYMNHFKGKDLTIGSVEENDEIVFYTIDEDKDDIKWKFVEEMFEKVTSK
jgi:hypothetical protein